MNQRKPNRKNWCSLGLAVLLCTALLVITTGTTFARYRVEKEREIFFRARVPDRVHIGTVSIVTAENDTNENNIEAAETEETDAEDEDNRIAFAEVFSPNSKLKWQKTGGVIHLSFAVANGVSEQEYSERDQIIRLRMIGSRGIWTETQVPTLYLKLPPEEESDQEVIITASVTPIAEGTGLHLEYGDGWIYTFLDENGEELYWELPGGELTYVTFTVALDGEIAEDLVLLQPQVIAEVIQK